MPEPSRPLYPSKFAWRGDLPQAPFRDPRKLEASAQRANQASNTATALAQSLGFVADILMKMAEGDPEATTALLQRNMSEARARMNEIHRLMGW